MDQMTLSVTTAVDSMMSQFSSSWLWLTDTLAFDTARLAEPDVLLRIILQVFLLLLSAFFSGSETALFSLSRLDLQQLRKKRDPRAEKLH